MQRNRVLLIAGCVVDWIVIFVSVFVFQRLGKIDGHRQRSSLADILLQYSYTGSSTVPNYALIILSVILPTLSIFLWTVFTEHRIRGAKGSLNLRLWHLQSSLLGLALSISLSQVITNLFKITVGRPRPDLISRCVPAAGSTDASLYGLSTCEICTQMSPSLLQDVFRSFPSGHSSMSFSGLAYLGIYLWIVSSHSSNFSALFLASRLQLFDQRSDGWKWFAVMLPLFGASLVAISRIMDNRHHAFDVFFGSAVGILTSFVACYQFFPGFNCESVYVSRLDNKQEDTLSADNHGGTSATEDTAITTPFLVNDNSNIELEVRQSPST